MKSSKIIQNGSKRLNSFIKGKLYISDSTVVLCTEDNKELKGVCLHDDVIPCYEGEYSDRWVSEMFIKFTGIVTLED